MNYKNNQQIFEYREHEVEPGIAVPLLHFENFEKIDGIRYIGANGIVYVRLRDNVSFIEAKKSVVDFDLPYGGSFSIGDTWSNPNISGNIAGSKGSYTIFGVCMFGTSIYDNFEIGSRMVYTFKKAN